MEEMYTCAFHCNVGQFARLQVNCKSCRDEHEGHVRECMETPDVLLQSAVTNTYLVWRVSAATCTAPGSSCPWELRMSPSETSCSGSAAASPMWSGAVSPRRICACAGSGQATGDKNEVHQVTSNFAQVECREWSAVNESNSHEATLCATPEHWNQRREDNAVSCPAHGSLKHNFRPRGVLDTILQQCNWKSYTELYYKNCPSKWAHKTDQVKQNLTILYCTELQSVNLEYSWPPRTIASY